VADNPDFQLEAARAALALHVEAKVPYYRDLVKTWAMELLLGLANSTTSTERDWANERLKQLGLHLPYAQDLIPDCSVRGSTVWGP
jgi:hypothetical protein